MRVSSFLAYVVGVSCAACSSTAAKPATVSPEVPAQVAAQAASDAPATQPAAPDGCSPREASPAAWSSTVRYQAHVSTWSDVDRASQACRDTKAGGSLPPRDEGQKARMLGPTSPGAYPSSIEDAIASLQPGEVGVFRTPDGTTLLIRREAPEELDLRWFAWSFRGAAGAPSATRTQEEAHALAQAALDGNKLGSNVDDLIADARSRGEWEHVARGQLTDPLDKAIFWETAHRTNPKASYFPLRLGPGEATIVDTEAGVYLVQRKPE